MIQLIDLLKTFEEGGKVKLYGEELPCEITGEAIKLCEMLTDEILHYYVCTISNQNDVVCVEAMFDSWDKEDNDKNKNGEWNDVEKESPTKTGMYLCIFRESDGSLGYSLALFDADDGRFYGSKVAYWMPLPEMPKEGMT